MNAIYTLVSQKVLKSSASAESKKPCDTVNFVSKVIFVDGK